MLHRCVTTIRHEPGSANLTGWSGRQDLHRGDRTRLYGIVGSLLLHGALVGALALTPSGRVGAPQTGERGLTVFEVQIVSSGDMMGASPEDVSGEGSASGPAVAEPRPDAPASEPTPPIRAAGPGSGGSMAAADQVVGAPGPRLAASDGALRSTYQSTLRAHVLRYRYYPEDARPDRLRGIVRVQFALSRDGRVLSAWVQTSSGHAVLDEAALDALRRAQPLPAIPAELPGEMEVLLPLDYIPPRLALAG